MRPCVPLTDCAWAENDADSRAADVWVRDLQRGVSSRFTVGESRESVPLITPDGLRVISVSTAVFVGAPLAWWLTTHTELGATGMWIANLVYALLNAGIMVAWLLRGRWAARYAT